MYMPFFPCDGSFILQTRMYTYYSPPHVVPKSPPNMCQYKLEFSLVSLKNVLILKLCLIQVLI